MGSKILGGGGVTVKSRQEVSFNALSGATFPDATEKALYGLTGPGIGTKDLTLSTAIDVNKSIIIPHTCSMRTVGAWMPCALRIKDANTIRGIYGTNNSNHFWDAEVIEYSGVKKVHSGWVVLNSTNPHPALSAVLGVTGDILGMNLTAVYNTSSTTTDTKHNPYISYNQATDKVEISRAWGQTSQNLLVFWHLVEV